MPLKFKSKLALSWNGQKLWQSVYVDKERVHDKADFLRMLRLLRKISQSTMGWCGSLFLLHQFHIQAQVQVLDALPIIHLPVYGLGRQQRVSQFLELLHLHQRTRRSFQILTFDWPNASCCNHLGSASVYRSSLFPLYTILPLQ